MGTVAVDAGNWEVKVCSKAGLLKFPADLGEYRERNLSQQFGDYDMAWEYQGKKGFAGTLAKYECEFGGALKGSSKAHEDAKMRILLALSMLDGDVFSVVVGQPIGKHTRAEKVMIKTMLLGRHTITVNGARKAFIVERVEVAAEGGAAAWSSPMEGLIRVLDIGSGTCNAATLDDMRYIDKDSFTLDFGRNTTKNNDLAAFARGVAVELTRKWRQDDTVLLCGGAAGALLPYLRVFFVKAELLKPILDGREYDPVYANVIGFYQLARGIYES